MKLLYLARCTFSPRCDDARSVIIGSFCNLRISTPLALGYPWDQPTAVEGAGQRTKENQQ
jgi:hypothetical protein